MILVLQIAAGIVLGVLALRYLGVIVRVAAWLAIAAAIAALAIGAYLFVTSASDSAKQAARQIAVAILIIAILVGVLQFSARGLGRLFLRCRLLLRKSPAYRRAATIAGVIDEWIFDDRTDRKFVDFVGGRIFINLVSPLPIFLLHIGGAWHFVSDYGYRKVDRNE
jgi:hypothetical protein